MHEKFGKQGQTAYPRCFQAIATILGPAFFHEDKPKIGKSNPSCVSQAISIAYDDFGADFANFGCAWAHPTTNGSDAGGRQIQIAVGIGNCWCETEGPAEGRSE